jgi:polyhydroxyalkanoate synthesis regulator protein|tara:strand:+ start:433 stop:696 length:264 start_codon:yes stop_codon:yes gene_type:complete
MTDEQMQNLLTSIIEMKNNLERMAEKQEEMHEDVKKINEAIYNPDQGIYARLRAIENWKDSMSKVIWTIGTGFVALVLNTLYQNLGG